MRESDWSSDVCSSDLTSVAKIVKDKRKKLGLTQEEFAARLGVERYNLSKWETGISRPKADVLLKIIELRKK
jgi:transcriptional regulator with XRE-family HTH domain